TFSLVGAPRGASIDQSTGVFTWTPTEAQGPGSYTFKVRVTDGVANTETPITVTVGEVNVAPTLTGGRAPATGSQGRSLTVAAAASVPDQPAQSLTFSLVGAPAGATIGSSSGIFSWTPTEGQGPGSYSFAVRVSDGVTSTDAPIAVTVNEVNVAPNV